MHPDTSVDAICVLFGKTRQAYYQKINYKYKEYAEESIIVDIVTDIRSEIGKIGGRKLWFIMNEMYPRLIGRDSLFRILEKNNLNIHKRKHRVRTTWSASWLRQFPNLIKDIVLTASNQLWVSDITYIETKKGFVYLHLVTDAYSKKSSKSDCSNALKIKLNQNQVKSSISQAQIKLKKK